MTEFSSFTYFFDEIVEGLASEIPEIVYIKFFQATHVLNSPAYTEVMTGIDRDNLLEKLEYLEDNEDANIAEQAKALKELIIGPDDD